MSTKLVIVGGVAAGAAADVAIPALLDRMRTIFRSAEGRVDALTATEDGSLLSGRETSADVGLDMKYGLTPGLTLDLTATECFDARDQLLRGKRLGEVIICADIEAFNTVVDIRQSGEEKGGCRPTPVAEFLNQLQAGFFR